MVNLLRFFWIPTICLTAVSNVVAQDDLPDGHGKELVERMCVGCHGVETVIAVNMPEALWASTVVNMVARGAAGTEEEIDIVIDYLTENFGAEEASSIGTGETQYTGVEQFKTQPSSPETEWRTYSHSANSQRFSPLAEINPYNVNRLRLAWSYSMTPETNAGEAATGPHAEDNQDSRPQSLRSSSLTPLVVNGTMYITSPYNRVSAIDPTSGEEVWTYVLPNGTSTGRRGPEYWSGDGDTPAQILFGSNDGKLYSLNASTGEPNEDFADNGVLDLNTGDIMRGFPGGNRLASPPKVYKNLVIVGGSTQESVALGPAGDVRAFDLRTGERVWTFHTIPREGEPFNDTWGGDSWKNRTGANVWGMFSVDEDRGIVYIPVAAPSVDQYGGDRPGDNLFGTSIVAVNAETGERIWHFQHVHHDIWDADMPSAPVLFDLEKDGETIPVVGTMSKFALLFILNRETGEPVYGVEERPVEKSNVPLEQASPTQPYPLKPAPLARMSVTADEIASVTPELHAACLEKFGDARLGGPFMPPGYNRLSVRFPGNHGGVNWGGMSYSPELGYIFMNINNLGQVSGQQDHDPASGPASNAGRGNRVVPDGPYAGVPGAGGRFSVIIEGEEQQLPCQEPPWGELIALDTKTAEVAWRVNLGITEQFPPELQNTGRPGNGGTIVTAGGLVFVGATDDARFRAFDAKNGEELWTYKLKGAAQATPITYLGPDNKQYVVITATGGGFFNNLVTDDRILAFTLDGK